LNTSPSGDEMRRECSNGHLGTADEMFCGECGLPLQARIAQSETATAPDLVEREGVVASVRVIAGHTYEWRNGPRGWGWYCDARRWFLTAEKADALADTSEPTYTEPPLVQAANVEDHPGDSGPPEPACADGHPMRPDEDYCGLCGLPRASGRSDPIQTRLVGFVRTLRTRFARMGRTRRRAVMVAAGVMLVAVAALALANRGGDATADTTSYDAYEPSVTTISAHDE
jgi:hypothetical protein